MWLSWWDEGDNVVEGNPFRDADNEDGDSGDVGDDEEEDDGDDGEEDNKVSGLEFDSDEAKEPIITRSVRSAVRSIAEAEEEGSGTIPTVSVDP